MAIDVGINSYFDVDEANEIIKTLMSTDSLRKIWDSTSREDKESLIINITERYDNNKMNYLGLKVDKKQPLQFPRIIDGEEVECPYKIKKGLLLQGITDLTISSSGSEEELLKRLGIKSFSDGSGASITFDNTDILNSDSKYSSGIYKDIYDAYFIDYTDTNTIHWA